MSWNLYRWVWRLEAPLYIGMPPAGVLNRCRLYVPARVMHGAVTAELARISYDGLDVDYGKKGHETGLNCRFTYLYPAEKINGEYYAWLPKYEHKESHESRMKEKLKTGLYWFRQDGKGMTDRDFRCYLLDSRAGTAIAPKTDTAEDGTLRETECINPWWRKTDKSSPVYLLGYVFLRENRFSRQFKEVDTLYIGGDTRYGLGKIIREKWDTANDIFGHSFESDKEYPEILSKHVFGHVPVHDKNANSNMFGNKEQIGSWDINKLWRKDGLSWTPGSYLKNEVQWKIDTYGFWVTDESLIHKSKRQKQREQFGKSSYKTQHLVAA